MQEIFLSASVPLANRGQFYRDADPFLIQTAVRSFVITALGRRRIVWGGHPSITPMVHAVCQDLGVVYEQAVLLVMSNHFRDSFPAEMRHFSNVLITDSAATQAESLKLMRETIIRRPHLTAAVFIGGMEGVLDEYEIIQRLRPTLTIVTVPATGGAARVLARRNNENVDVTDIDFPRLFVHSLGIDLREPRIPLIDDGISHHG